MTVAQLLLHFVAILWFIDGCLMELKNKVYLIHHISNDKKCFLYIDARSVSRTSATSKAELFMALFLAVN